jgi:hypothetical protein
VRVFDPSGSFGVKSAAAIVLPPQSCALALGAVRSTVVPKTNKAAAEGPQWEVNNQLSICIFCPLRILRVYMCVYVYVRVCENAKAFCLESHLQSMPPYCTVC